MRILRNSIFFAMIERVTHAVVWDVRQNGQVSENKPNKKARLSRDEESFPTKSFRTIDIKKHFIRCFHSSFCRKNNFQKALKKGCRKYV